MKDEPIPVSDCKFALYANLKWPQAGAIAEIEAQGASCHRGAGA